MRIDKYLKVSRLIKRLTIRFGEHLGQYEILSTAETVRKDQAAEMYRVVQEDASMNSERNQA